MSNRGLLTIENLVVVNSLGTNKAEESYLMESAKAWKLDSKHKLIIPTDCAHRLWLGSKEVFEEFPEDGRANLEFIEGPDAYKFLLRMLSGLNSPEVCETHIRKQFKDSWSHMQTPEEGENVRKQQERKDHVNKYMSLYGNVMKDSGVVSEKVLSQYKKPLYESAAKDISGQVRGDKIVIIANVNEYEALDARHC